MFIIVANWKSQLTFHQTLALCEGNLEGYGDLGDAKGIETVICPSFEALHAVALTLQDTAIQVGAQDCSAFKQGAYTGQVTAASLAEVGCTYCIIGHYESRTHLHETDQLVAEKMQQLVTVGIEPILCIGETEQEREAGYTFQALTRQLTAVAQTLASHDQVTICIAYEPIWAIGTGQVAQKSQLTEVFAWLSTTCATLFAEHTVRLLYGGSVTAETAGGIKKIPGVDGLLVGTASLDFKKFEKIVSSCS